jgi:hypothetical protein
MSRNGSDVVREAERVLRRASWWAAWKPVLIAGAVGFVAALLVVVVLVVSWHPDGMGI